MTISGYEQHLSQKAAEIVCKAALDAVSLLFGDRCYFLQQALGHERLPPLRTHSMLEFRGFLWPPGSEWGLRVRTLSDTAVRKHLDDHSDWIAAVASILHALVNPESGPHPNLAKRWTTALDWFAEGQRERQDSLAVAKMATSLDVLSYGGKAGGILKMLEHLTGKKASDPVVLGRRPLTLKQLVDKIYSSGRSQILHGTEVDRLRSFESWRHYVSELARIALLSTAQRLQHYKGTDADDAFRLIPASPSR